jgi:hypothetical protein
MTTKDIRWAAKIILELAKVPVQPKFIDAFVNYNANKMWVKSVLKTAAPAASVMSNPYYYEAVEILRQNGISDNIYDTGS